MKEDMQSDYEEMKPLEHHKRRAMMTLRWVIFAVFSGIVIGAAGAVFHKIIDAVTEARTGHPQLLLLLPLGAVFILLLYGRFGEGTEGGTNLILTSIRGQKTVPLRLAPLIFIATTVSHLAGASVGREGAALQLGGSLGHFIGEMFHFSARDKKTLVMTGMSAAFSAMFGTPLAAAVFPMEVVSVGIMHFSALLPCTIAALIARGVAIKMGASAPYYDLGVIPGVGILPMLQVFLLAALAGFLAAAFCFLLQRSEHLTEKVLKNAYIRAAVIGAAVLMLTYLSGGQTYNGAGSSYISVCIEGQSASYSFLMKILITVLSICAGYKGGEIVPSFFIGASFGCFVGSFLALPPGLCAAIGMGAVFCGVTNSPISSFIIMCEMFGFEGAPYYLLGCAVSYVVSGYYGLYTGQKIVYSKYRLNHIDRDTL